RVAEGVGAPSRATGQCGRELVQLEELAVEAARREKTLEDNAEAHEQAGADQTDDLSLPLGVPALLVQIPLEQPRQADLVREVLDLRRLALALREVLRELWEVARQRVVRDPELTKERAVHDEIRVASDRRREVAVRGACEAGMAEVLRVVARLLERPQDERWERLPSAPRLLDIRGDELRGLAGRDGGELWRELFRHGRGRHAEVGELREQLLDRLRIGALVHAVERRAVSGREEPGDSLVREDHQLLDEHVGVGFRLVPGLGDASVVVETEHGLRRLDLECDTRETPRPQHGG